MIIVMDGMVMGSMNHARTTSNNRTDSLGFAGPTNKAARYTREAYAEVLNRIGLRHVQQANFGSVQKLHRNKFTASEDSDSIGYGVALASSGLNLDATNYPGDPPSGWLTFATKLLFQVELL
jgi:hypothetical protein